MSSLSNLVTELNEMFEFWKPDDPHFLKDTGLDDKISAIQRFVSDPNNNELRKLEILYDFNVEWFPDSIDENDQKELRDTLEAARLCIQRCKHK